MDLVNESKPVLEKFVADFEAGTPPSDTVDMILETLKKLEKIDATFELLSSTQIGKTVAKLQKMDNASIATLAKTVCDNWRNQVALEQSKKRKRSDLNESTSSASGANDSQSSTAQAEPDSKRAKIESGNTTPLNQSSGSVSMLGSTKSDMRNKIQTRFNEALQKALTATAPEKKSGLLNAEDVAVAIEEALFKHNGSDVTNLKEYGAHYQTLIMRINDVNNQWLRDAILSGALGAADLVKMTPQELASPEQREKMRQMQEEIMAKKRIEKKKATSTAFTCKKCHQSLVHYFQLQTRSADEPMTTFIECINCGNSWKV